MRVHATNDLLLIEFIVNTFRQLMMYMIVIFRLIASPPLQSQKRTPASVQVVLSNNTIFLNVAFPTQQNCKNAKS